MNSASPPEDPPVSPLSEVRYSLPALLAEVKQDRKAGAFAQERFTQVEIEKLFKARAARHAKRRK